MRFNYKKISSISIKSILGKGFKKNFKSKTFKRLFFCYISMFSIPIFIFSGIILFQQMEADEHTAIEIANTNAASIAGALDIGIKESLLFSNRLMSTAWVSKACSNSEIITRYFDSVRKREIVDELILHKASIAIAADIAIIFPKKNIGIDTASFGNISDCLSRIGFETEKQKLKLMNELKRVSAFSMYSYDEFGVYGIESDDGKDILLMSSIDISPSPKAVMLIRVDSEALDRLVEAAKENEFISLTITQNQKKVFEKTSQETNGQKKLLTQIPSNTYLFDYSFVYFDGSRIISSILKTGILFVVLIAVGFALSSFLAAVSYSPILHLIGLVKRSEEEENDVTDYRKNEFDVIEELFNKLNREKASLSRELKKIEVTLKNNQLLSLLKGGFEESPIYENLTGFKKEDYFKVVLITVKSSSDSMLKLYLSIESSLSGQVEYELVSVSESCIALIFVAADEEALDGLNKIIDKMLRFMTEKRGILAEATIGGSYNGFIGISKSYQDVKERGNDIFMSKSISENAFYSENTRYYYPTDWEIQLINLLKTGNEETSLKIIDELEKENSSRDLPQNINIKVTMLIFDTLIRVADELNMKTGELSISYENSTIEENARNQWTALKEIVLAITRNGEVNISGDNLDGEDIIAYTKESYGDYDLSLKSLSEKFKLSVSAISRQFKASARIGFAEYLCRVRMEKAKQYMKETDYSMEKIAGMVGYESYMSFRRAFIRIMGITPSEYRDKGL